MVGYKHLPYGVTDAPAKWQTAIEQVLEILTCVQVILDDTIITGSNDSEHLKNLEAVLQRLGEFGLGANMAKCVFFKERTEFSGYSVDGNGLQQNTDNVKAITEREGPQMSVG